MPVCVWLIRTFAPTARGHGTEAVIAAIHRAPGRSSGRSRRSSSSRPSLTLAFGGSVGKEGPCAQIGAAITSLFADMLRLSDEDRRRLVICGIGAGFAAVFGTPMSGALFGIEVLYLGRIEYAVLFPCLVSGIVAHLVCGVAPRFRSLHESIARPRAHASSSFSRSRSAAIFGLIALILIETMRGLEKVLARDSSTIPTAVAAARRRVSRGLLRVVGTAYAGLGVRTIEAALAGPPASPSSPSCSRSSPRPSPSRREAAAASSRPSSSSARPAGAALARLFVCRAGAFAAFGFVGVLAAAANTPIAAAVMGMELLPGTVGVYAALCAGTAFLIVGHRSVYASQKLGLSKSAGLDVLLDMPVGELTRSGMTIREGSLTSRVHRRRRRTDPLPDASGSPPRP